MELSSYIAVLVQIAVALGIGIAIVGASHIFGQRAKRNALKDSAYECGNEPEGTPHPRFGARFYVVAMLFVLFDIEVVFMIPFAMAYPELVSEKLPIVLPALCETFKTSFFGEQVLNSADVAKMNIAEFMAAFDVTLMNPKVLLGPLRSMLFESPSIDVCIAFR